VGGVSDVALLGLCALSRLERAHTIPANRAGTYAPAACMDKRKTRGVSKHETARYQLPDRADGGWSALDSYPLEVPLVFSRVPRPQLGKDSLMSLHGSAQHTGSFIVTRCDDVVTGLGDQKCIPTD
jgi:hypothetical protein